MRSTRSRLVALVSSVALVLLLSAPSGATTIDNFEDGSFGPLTDSTPAAGANGSTQFPLPSNTIGGERRSNVFLTSGTQASASLTLSGGDDGVVFDIDPVSTADVEFTYLFAAAPVDITTGSQNRFQITLTSAPATGTISIQAIDGSSFMDTQSTPIGGPGVYTLFFNLFLDGATPVDFADLETLRVAVEGAAAGSTLSYTISDVSAVPEPGALIFVALGALGLRMWAERACRPGTCSLSTEKSGS